MAASAVGLVMGIRLSNNEPGGFAGHLHPKHAEGGGWKSYY